MGYTHYFTQKRAASDAEWAAITADFRKLYEGGHLPSIRFEDNHAAHPEISSDLIRFNGPGHDGHETMLLAIDGEGIEFCKTAQKPYDLAVVALLILAHYHAPEVWDITSDGYKADWQPGLDIIQRQLYTDACLPPAIIQDDPYAEWQPVLAVVRGQR